MWPETRDATERLAANTVYIAIDAAQSSDDDITKLEQRQPTRVWQNERFFWQEGPAGSAEENVLNYFKIHGTASQRSQ